MGRHLRQIVASSWVLFGLTGCQVLPGATSGSGDTSNQCTPQEVRQVAERFIDAFNRGDTGQLDQLVSGDQFGWYSTDAPGQRLNAEADDRSDLIAYFAARHRQHERLVLISLDVTYADVGRGGFWFRLTRRADDGLPPTRYSGKGEIQCATRPSSVVVWAMARDPWSPIELVPEATALLVIVGGIGFAVLWRRRMARRLAPVRRAKANVNR